MIDANLLARIGAALYGEHWKRPLAERLDVSERKMRRWSKGEEDVPLSVMHALHAIVMAEHETLCDAAADMTQIRHDLENIIEFEIVELGKGAQE
jgi:hypothetical protein